MFTDFVNQIEASYGVIPALDLEKFYAEFPWGKYGLNSEQKQLVQFTKRYLSLIEEGKKIVFDTISKGKIKLNLPAVEAYVYFYRAFKLSGLSNEYSVDSFISKIHETVNKLDQLEGVQPTKEMEKDVNELHRLFDFITAQTDILSW